MHEHQFGISDEVSIAISNAGWFMNPGAFVLVDGQFGSTGKGLLAGALAEAGSGQITMVTSNAGPNSGHTAYDPVSGEKIMTQQIPVAAVVLDRLIDRSVGTYLNAGAIIDKDILERESKLLSSMTPVYIHPCAAVIEQVDRDNESGGAIAAIASTGKGVGSALARKILRQGNVFGRASHTPDLVGYMTWEYDWLEEVVLVETPQGFSLGVNSPLFYPHTTSRECTVMQALADARIPAQRLKSVATCYRTYPIRVGNTDKGHSGNGYEDQDETTWEAIGVEPEYTSVTHRMRRVFTWSRQQFRESVMANEPDTLFINFMNYLKPDEVKPFMRGVLEDYLSALLRPPKLVLTGWGPKASDIQVWPL